MRKPPMMLACLVLSAGVTGSTILAAPAMADPPTLIGGMNVAGYCAAKGFSGAGLIKGGVVGPNFAYANWACVNSDDSLTHPISMEQVCKQNYGVRAIVAMPTDPNDAFSWNCYAPGNHSA